MLVGLTQPANIHYARLRAAHRRRWETIRATQREKIERAAITLRSFHVGDVVDWLPGVPEAEVSAAACSGPGAAAPEVAPPAVGFLVLSIPDHPPARSQRVAP